jgi:steroid 5-alpha reductase family enzyme
VIVGWVALAVGTGCRGRRILLAALVSLWGLRLAGYLVARKVRERREDPRYGEWRERWGSRFVLVSLVSVFLFQGFLIWVVSLPVQGSAPQGDRLSVLDWIGVAAWVVGITFEAVGDYQLARFESDPPTGAGSWIAACGATLAIPTTSVISPSGGGSI